MPAALAGALFPVLLSTLLSAKDDSLSLYTHYSLITDPITVFAFITKGQHPCLRPHLCRPRQSSAPFSLFPNLAPVLGKHLSSYSLGFLPLLRISLWGAWSLFLPAIPTPSPPVPLL